MRPCYHGAVRWRCRARLADRFDAFAAMRAGAAALGIAASLGLSCRVAGHRASGLPGSSAPRASAPESTRERRSTESATWARFQEVGEWQPILPAFPAANHLDGRYELEVRVNPQARDAVARLLAGGELAVGTVIVGMHYRIPSKQPGPIFVMEKVQPGRWRFLSLDQAGRQTSGDSTHCARCHAEAPADWLFIPRSRGEVLADPGSSPR